MNPTFTKVWIVGAGAIGSVIAAVLGMEDRIEFCLVGQSPQARAVAKKGLTFQSGAETVEGISVRVRHPREVPALTEQDLVLLTGKTPDLEKTVLWLKERCAFRTGIIALQNGIGAEQILVEKLERPVDRGFAFFGANSVEPGKIRYFSGRIQLRPSAVTEAFSRVMAGSRLPCEISADFKKTEWQKMAINCIANPLAGILQIGNRGIIDPALNPAKEEILNEVRQVARAEGVELETSPAEINRILAQDNVPSLRIDLERNLRTEIDFLNGAVVRLGEKHGIATPANSLLVSMVKYLEKS